MPAEMKLHLLQNQRAKSGWSRGPFHLQQNHKTSQKQVYTKEETLLEKV